MSLPLLLPPSPIVKWRDPGPIILKEQKDNTTLLIEYETKHDIRKLLLKKILLRSSRGASRDREFIIHGTREDKRHLATMRKHTMLVWLLM